MILTMGKKSINFIIVYHLRKFMIYGNSFYYCIYKLLTIYSNIYVIIIKKSIYIPNVKKSLKNIKKFSNKINKLLM